MQDAMCLGSTENQSGCIFVRGRTTALKKRKKTLWKKIIDDVMLHGSVLTMGAGALDIGGRTIKERRRKEPRDWRGTINESS